MLIQGDRAMNWVALRHRADTHDRNDAKGEQSRDVKIDIFDVLLN